MQDIINPVDKSEIKKELTPDKFLRHTNYGNNELYVITYHGSPKTLREVGRLREVTFRAAGGGTGKELDIDKFDYAEEPYQQLISWDPEEQEILGGYRYKVCDEHTKPEYLATEKLFHFSPKFIREYLPYTIELGRSFIQPKFQSTGNTRKTLYALDNLWDGLGALVVKNQNHEYFFGKVTMYPHFNLKARDLILRFLHKEFYDAYDLIHPKNPETLNTNPDELDKIFTGNSYEENLKILSQEVRKLGENIPPLINAYMNLSRTMKIFGTALNKSFGDVEETGIMITISDIYPKKKKRHVESFKKEAGKN
ncbi:MAG: GNAT family N-acetyltransferase [Bacteroidales bacterium]